MAHFKKTYKFSSLFPQKEFTELLFDKFEASCKVARMDIVQRTETVLGVKGAFFRFASNGFHYLNGVACGRLEIKKTETNLVLERTFCYKEFMLIALVFTLLPVWSFFSPIYQFTFVGIVLDHKIIAYLLFFIIWGVFFAGNIILSTIRFSNLLNTVKIKIISEYLDR